MNLRNKIILITLLTLGTLFSGCDFLIYDDLEECPQGVYVSFYSMTPCDVDSSFIGNTSAVTVFAFDENLKLAQTVTEKDVNLSRDFEVLVPLTEGRYTFIAWAGMDDNFDVRSFTPGVTTKEDVMLSLKETAKFANELADTRLWQGENIYPVLLESSAEYGSVYKYVDVNLLELTNRVKVIVEFDESVKEVTPQDLAIEISSSNSVLNIDRTMPKGTKSLVYPLLDTQYTANSVSWDYVLLDLQPGYSNNLNITYPAEGKVLFNGDLIASILLNTVSGGLDLRCENDLTVKFIVKDYCAECDDTTHFSCAIYVNNWIVHSYEWNG